MKCPTCQDVDLVISERQGVEIDYCPACRGVWLDRGELDKIIERSAAFTTPAPRMKEDDDRRQEDYSRRDQAPKKKKRESFLSELFDF